MRVCLLSTYIPQRCGIGTYAAELTSALSVSDDLQSSVIAQQGAMQIGDSAVAIWPTFERAESHVAPIIRLVRELRAADIPRSPRAMQ